MKEETFVSSTVPAMQNAANDAIFYERSSSGYMAPVGKGLTRKRRSQSFSLLKAALNIFQDKPGEKENKKSKNDYNNNKKKKNDWKVVADSMRPLTLQDKSPTPSLPSMSPSCSFESLPSIPGSPSPSHVSSCSSLSHYASAGNLQDLDAGSDADEVFDAVGGDEMIDAKAEEFIAQFYQQIRLQEAQDF